MDLNEIRKIIKEEKAKVVLVDSEGTSLIILDYEEYKKKLQMLIRDSEKRKVFSENSRKFAYNELTLDKMLDQYEQVFKEVLKEYENITHSL